MSEPPEVPVRARRIPHAGALAAAGGVALLLGLPFVLPPLWLQTGLFAMAAAIGAIGLTLLTGSAGQLSLGHSFFLAVGAYGYVWAAGESGESTAGLGLPGPVAAILAVALAGVAGGLFSPISGRLRGMYLGVATLALVFIGHHVLLELESVTGGFNGRSVPPLTIPGFGFTDDDPAGLLVLGHPFGALERLWYLGVVLVAIAWITARNLLRGRPGRALGALRDSEIAASVMGVSVARYRSGAFVVSSMYAGAAGVLIALVFRRVVPDYFGFALALDYLAMIVIGGLGSVGGAILGAAFVTSLPQLLTQYADSLPLVVAPGSTEPGVTPAELSRYLYGLAIVLVLLFTRQGLIGLLRRLRPAHRRPPPQETRSRPAEATDDDVGPDAAGEKGHHTATAKEPTT
ncbi:branched-chain amino acid ABC transporter permease [Actinoalloteichus hymeniacidonis]|uniref:Amino acid/amide ABC transporter membrane protein 2, HAAT family n=1 Tax=Actinoalloteichus hymeniacidonis TaxID=340345 RepID=A0AAC9MYX3_9PSEU|nr:branched-chain amino acid ABC transporter permease [Actinoalloteichus hymeniacidonis]AOS63331.1 amino acid/amide ABC transporter membrane protein 2, HAAT family [Actinoalloteichus hymeniacidonis]MBB5908630.1 branched-chain amino acid transport system permease protein [Actinoalloteichus hymeniacidonis]